MTSDKSGKTAAGSKPDREADALQAEIERLRTEVRSLREEISTLQEFDLIRVEELRESEERFRRIIQQMPYPVQVFSPEGGAVMVNRAFLDMFGIPSSEMIVGRYNIFDDPGIESMGISAEIRRAFQGEPVSLAEINIPGGRIGKKPGAVDHPIPSMEAALFPVFGHGGEIRQVVVIFKDITERKRLEEESIRTSKLDSIGVLAGGIAHDFNNLLLAVLGNLSLARRILTTEDRAGKAVVDAEKAALQARDLTRQLLTFSLGGEPVKKPVSLSDLIEECAVFALHGSNVKCVREYEPDIRHVDADRGQICQVINNLLINAAHAMPDGGTVAVRLASEALPSDNPFSLPPGDYLAVSVTDHGAGIDPEIIDKIFDPYFTTKEKGHGLGLATSYSIVKRHGGHITVEATPGKGARFLVFLPAILEAPLEKPPSPSLATAGKGKVLVMDDDELVLKAVIAMLDHLGYKPYSANDGKEAVELFREAAAENDSFDFVILDLTVPGGMGGKQAAAEIRKIDSKVKMIVSSGYSEDKVMSDFRAHGFDGMIAKPFLTEDLASLLAKLMD